jgi:hypothetical protein
MDVVSYLLGKKSSGGGGLSNIETGTFTPIADIQRPQIDFKNEHEELPILVYMQDTSEEAITGNGLATWVYYDNELICGYPYMHGKNKEYTEQKMSYVNDYNNVNFANNCTYKSSSETADTSNSYPRYYVQNNYFKPGASGSTKATFIANRTYYWFAIWK